MNKYKKLLSDTALISIGTFTSKLLVFLMVRFYTECLTPSEYGTSDLIMQTANLLFPLISFGITDAVFRFALDRSENRKNIFSAGVYTILAGALLLFFISPVLRLSEGFRGYVWLIVLCTLSSCFHSLCGQFVRATGNIKLFSIQGIVNTALVILLNLLFLFVFRLGITGYILSVAVADLFCTAFLVLKEGLWKQLVLRPGKQCFRQMLRYSIPLIPTTVFWWVTAVSDRYMVSAFLGAEVNGLYTVAYKIPTILTLLSGVFLEAWQFSAVSEAHTGKKEHIWFYGKIWGMFQSVMFLACSLMVAFSQAAIQIMSGKSYYNAWIYMPLICCSMAFAAFVTFFGSVYMVEKKSGMSFWTSLAGAVINIVLNLLLIPTALGAQGAAIATLASYLFVFIIRAISARRLIPFRLYKKRLLFNTAVLSGQTLCMTLRVPGWQWTQGFFILLLLFGNRKQIKEGIKKIYSLKS